MGRWVECKVMAELYTVMISVARMIHAAQLDLKPQPPLGYT
jgi:hypothetical protein